MSTPCTGRTSSNLRASLLSSTVPSAATSLFLQVSQWWKPYPFPCYSYCGPSRPLLRKLTWRTTFPHPLIALSSNCVKNFIRCLSLAFHLSFLLSSLFLDLWVILTLPLGSLVSCSSYRSSAKNPPTPSGWGHPHAEESRWVWPFFLTRKEETVPASPNPCNGLAMSSCFHLIFLSLKFMLVCF